MAVSRNEYSSCLSRHSRAVSRPSDSPRTLSSSPEMASGSTSVPYKSKASTSRSPRSPAALGTGDGGEQPGEVLVARAARRQVRGDARVALGHVFAGHGELDVD